MLAPDPVLSVACPWCHAETGQRCRKPPKGYVTNTHVDRLRAFEAAGGRAPDGWGDEKLWTVAGRLVDCRLRMAEAHARIEQAMMIVAYPQVDFPRSFGDCLNDALTALEG